MTGKQRREEIIHILSQQEQPYYGNLLAKQLQVSRQVVVEDIASLRA